MNYKVGDKVKIKENFLGHINALEEVLGLSNRIVTIKKVHNYYYEMEEIGWGWGEYNIEKIEKQIYEPILDRWEILDL